MSRGFEGLVLKREDLGVGNVRLGWFRMDMKMGERIMGTAMWICQRKEASDRKRILLSPSCLGLT